MEIQTTVELQATEEEKHMDKEYHLKCFRLKQAIHKLNKISMDIAMGRMYPDDTDSVLIFGWKWIYGSK